MTKPTDKTDAENKGIKDDDLPLLDNGVFDSSSNQNNDHAQKVKKGRGRSVKWTGKLKWLPLLVVIFAVGGFVGLYFQPPGLQFVMKTTGLSPGAGSENPIAVPVQISADTENRAKTPVVSALGSILPLADISILAPPFGASNARVAQLYVEEGEHVSAGQLIASMDNLAILEADWQSATADKEVAQAQLQQTKFSLKNTRAVAQAELEKVQANFQQAKGDLARAKVLKQDGVITQSELDKLIASEGALARGVDSARANLEKYVYDNIDDHPDVKLALSNLQAAELRLNAKQQDLNSASMRAPNDGVILDINARVGERPGDSGIATFGDTQNMQVKLEVYQSDIQFVHLGAQVQVSSSALGDRVLLGKVTRIGLEVKKQQLIAQSPAANTDARVIIVNVALDAESSIIAAQFTGLEVLASIQTVDEQ